MAEYIDKGAVYNKIAELEELARNRYLDTPSNSPAYARYMAQMQERTALKFLIADFPAADVAPVVYGWWVPVTESEMTGWNPDFAGRDPIAGYSCSNCKEEAVFDCNNEFVLTKYCPNCGAKMDGGSVNE